MKQPATKPANHATPQNLQILKYVDTQTQCSDNQTQPENAHNWQN